MVSKKKQLQPELPIKTAEGEGPLTGQEPRKAGRPREIQYSLDKKFTLMLPKDVHKALKVKSAELEQPMTTMIIDAIKKTYEI